MLLNPERYQWATVYAGAQSLNAALVADPGDGKRVEIYWITVVAAGTGAYAVQSPADTSVWQGHFGAGSSVSFPCHFKCPASSAVVADLFSAGSITVAYRIVPVGAPEK